jgi:hypothetical protein
MDSEIADLLRTIQEEGDEDLHAAARDAMGKYHAEALARPNRAFVDLLRVRLNTRLKELLAAAKRDGRC